MEHFQILDVVLHEVIENVMGEIEIQMNLVEDQFNFIYLIKIYLPNLGCC